MDGQNRFISVDFLRGLTVAGMILVNNPGSWEYVYQPLLHAPWHGCTIADLIFPFFLFIVGISIHLALKKKKLNKEKKGKVVLKILKRGALLFLFGLFLNSLPLLIGGIAQIPHSLFALGVTIFSSMALAIVWSYLELRFKQQELDKGNVAIKVLQRSFILSLSVLIIVTYPYTEWETLRIPGVLQRIAVVFGVCAIVFLYTSIRGQIIFLLSILIGYWLLMTFVPVPGVGTANLEPETNLAAWLDRFLLDGHLWKFSKTWDPEGVLSTLPAIASGLTGVLTGSILTSNKPYQSKLKYIFIGGGLLIALGLLWHTFFPINKSLWTSSYVLLTSGIALTFLGLSSYVIDIQKNETFAKPLIAFGSNAITAYMGSELIAVVFYEVQINQLPLKAFLYQLTNSFFTNPYNSSLLLSFLWVFAFFIPIWIIYKKGIFIKV